MQRFVDETLKLEFFVLPAYYVTICIMSGSPPTYMNRRCDWLLQTIKDNKTIEM